MCSKGSNLQGVVPQGENFQLSGDLLLTMMLTQLGSTRLGNHMTTSCLQISIYWAASNLIVHCLSEIEGYQAQVPTDILRTKIWSRDGLSIHHKVNLAIRAATSRT